MMHPGNMHTRLRVIALSVLISAGVGFGLTAEATAGPRANSHAFERFELMQARIAARQERINERVKGIQERVCTRMSARLGVPAFCVAEAPTEHEEDDTEDDDIEEQDPVGSEDPADSEEEDEEDEDEVDDESEENADHESDESDPSDEVSDPDPSGDEGDVDDESEDEEGADDAGEDDSAEEEVSEDPADETPSDSEGRVVLSEVYYTVATEQESDPLNEWVELYNGTDASVDLTGWQLRDNNTTRVLPEGSVIPAGGFAVIVATGTTAGHWEFPSDAVVIDLGTRIGNGLGNTGDELYLENDGGVVVDALSWGSFTTVFDPALSTVARGSSLARCPLSGSGAAVWQEKEVPTPGFVSTECDTVAGSEAPEPSDPSTDPADEVEDDEETETPIDEEDPADESSEDEANGDDDVDAPIASSTAHIVLTEVYYAVGEGKGSDPDHEWVELYNGTGAPVDLSGWQLQDNITTRTLPEGTILLDGQFAVVIATGTTQAFWSVPESALVIELGTRIGNGLGNAGDELYLRDGSETVIDSLSWGSFTTVFDPSIPVIPAARRGASIERCPIIGTSAADAWVEKPEPTPGFASSDCVGAADGDGSLDPVEDPEQDPADEEGSDEGVSDEGNTEEDEQPDASEPSEGDESDDGSTNTDTEPTQPTLPTMSSVLITEVYYMVDTETRGSDPANEWIELYNGTGATVDLSGWQLRDNITTRTLPDGAVLPDGEVMVVVATSATFAFWDVPEGTLVATLGANIGNGLGNSGDELTLLTDTDAVVDALSWGSFTTVFDPAVPAISAAERGSSIARCPLVDKDSAADWVRMEEPTPGVIPATCAGDAGSGDDAEPSDGTDPDSGTTEGEGDGDMNGDTGVPADEEEAEVEMPTNTGGHIVLSEVYFYVAAEQGTDPTNEWVELYNAGTTTVDLSGWTILDNSSARALPEGAELAPGQYAVVVGTSTTAGYWTIPATTLVINLDARLGNGLGNAGDELYLRDASETVIDALSWGSFVSVFDPSIPAIPAARRGASIERVDVAAAGTGTAVDWMENATPTPGQ